MSGSSAAPPGQAVSVLSLGQQERRRQTLGTCAQAAEALVFLIAGQSNAGGVAAFSPETNVKSGMAEKHPTIRGSTAAENRIPTAADAYPRSYIWTTAFERLTPGKNLKGGYRDPWRHGLEFKVTAEDANAHLLDLDLGSNEKNFAAWAWTENNGHLSSKAFLELSRKILSGME